MKHGRPDYTPTPDRRYFVVRGRLWRLSNPWLDPEVHQNLVKALMTARRAVRAATTPEQRIAARVEVDSLKRALGERGDPWWSDGAPDYNWLLAENTPYAAWFDAREGPSAEQTDPNIPDAPTVRHG